MSGPKSIRVSAIQMCSTDDRESNLLVASRLIEEAALEGAEIVALPENFSFLGDGAAKLAAAEDPETGRSIRFLRDQSARCGVNIVGGSIPVRAAPDKVTNTCFVVRTDGSIAARYDKMHLFDVAVDKDNTFQESEHVRPGDDVVTVDVSGFTLGLSICYDLRFPELFRRLATAGASVIFVPSAFTMETGKAHWNVLVRARAIENLCYVVAPAQYGRHSKRRISFGHSLIVGPWGDVLGGVADGDATVSADVSLTRIEDARRRIPALEHIRLG
ncbi:MAG: carbon-nitrogen hydrolase family protein [Rhodothermia bacterium]|nr:carbon-nitrogen hydrolase family protein [Rhodothermia bacterium]